MNGTIEIFFEILNTPLYNTIQNLTGKFEGVSNTLVCSDINLSDQNLAYSAEIKYYADGYTYEFYHIQRADIDESTAISLYPLNSSDSTDFLVKYQDDNLVKVEGAIIQLLRKYISDNVYEVVEAPLTSDDGTAIVHVDLNTNKYKVIVMKNGVVLDIFDNIVFDCESELSGQCEQNLYGAIDSQNEVPIETTLDFSYSIDTTGDDSVSVTYSVPSGTPSTVNIQLVQTDQFGTSTLCNKTIISSSGSTSCTYNESIGDSYLDLVITKDGVPQAKKAYVVEEDSGLAFLDNNFFIVFIFLLSIIGMAFTSPEWIIVNSVLTMFIAGALFLLNRKKETKDKK
jgi:hypothetical protein